MILYIQKFVFLSDGEPVKTLILLSGKNDEINEKIVVHHQQLALPKLEHKLCHKEDAEGVDQRNQTSGQRHIIISIVSDIQ